MTQDDLDIKNAISTLSKIRFFQSAKHFKISVLDIIEFIKNKKNVSFEEAESILYRKAGEYEEDIFNKKVFLEYLLK